MFVKETTVRRSGRSYTYLQMVEGYRDERGRVRHRVVANLGRKEALKESGQLEALAGSFARLDPPLAGVRREVGPLLLVWHFLERLELVATIDAALPRSARSQLSVGEVVAALIASRLCSPSPLYDVAGWASGAAVHELLGASCARCARCRPPARTASGSTCARTRAALPSSGSSRSRSSGCWRSRA